MTKTRVLVRSSLVLALALSCQIVVSVSQVQRAAAEPGCGDQSNYFDGFSSAGWPSPQPRLYEGVSANITDAGGYGLCSGNTTRNNFVTAWTMLADSIGAGYVQSGYMYRAGPDVNDSNGNPITFDGCVRRWSEVSEYGGLSFADYYLGGCAARGTTHRFWQQMVYVNNQFVLRSNMDTTVIHQTSWSPLSAWTPPYGVDVFSESTYPVNFLPGRSTSPEDFDDLQVQYYADDSWHDTCGNIYLMQRNDADGSTDVPTGLWGVTAPSCDHIQTWTNG